jgi:hypothetical protein
MDNIAYKDGVLGVEVSPQSPMPVDQKGTASTINTISGETVQLFYSNAGVATIDAGQDAGVAVSAKLAFTNIKTQMGSVEATAVNTSLSFTAGALTTEVDRLSVIISVKGMPFASQIAAITSGMTNGQYAVDYATGTIWGVKATTATTLANATYKVQLSGGSSTPAITTPTAVPSTLSSSLPVSLYEATRTAATDGNVYPEVCTPYGAKLVSMDDAIAGENFTVDRLSTMMNLRQWFRTTTALTQVVKSGYATDVTIVIGATTTGLITIYNNTAGSGTVAYVVPVGTVANTQIRLPFEFTVGVTYVTAAADTVTVGCN